MSVFVRTRLGWARTSCVRRWAQEAGDVEANTTPGEGLDGRERTAPTLRLARDDVQWARPFVVEAQRQVVGRG